MPLLQFLCEHCAKLFEYKVPLDKWGKKIKCPHCKKVLKQVLFPVHFRIN